MRLIDLTLMDSGDEVEEDSEDEISLAAAPCPKCHKTFNFSGGEYERHVETCSLRMETTEVKKGKPICQFRRAVVRQTPSVPIGCMWTSLFLASRCFTTLFLAS